MAVSGAGVVVLSGSRGGVLTLVGAGLVVGLLLAWRELADAREAGQAREGGPRSGSSVSFGGSRALLVGLGVLAALGVLVVGFDAVTDRLGTLADPMEAQNNRTEILRSLVPAFWDQPWTGTGFGTFEVVYPVYDREGARASLTTHAENGYAQLLVETGVVGLALVLAFAGLVLSAAWSAVRPPRKRPRPRKHGSGDAGAGGGRRRRTSSASFLGFGLLLGWLAVMAHSLSDFGQHVPLVAMLTAMTAAGLLNLSATRRPPEGAADSAAKAPHAHAGLGLRLGLGVVFVGLLALSLVGASRLGGPAEARSAYGEALGLADRMYGGRGGSLDGEALSALGPDADERLVAAFGRAASLDPSWPAYAYLRDYYALGLVLFDARGRRVAVAGDPLAEAELAAVRASIDAARRAFPMYGPLHGLAGEARFYGSAASTDSAEREVGLALLERGAAMTPHDPQWWFEAGAAAARAGQVDRASASFARAMALRGGLRRSVVELYLAELGDVSAALAAASGDAGALGHLRSRMRRLRLDRDADGAAVAASAKAEQGRLRQAAAESAGARPSDWAAWAAWLVREQDGPESAGSARAEALGWWQRAVSREPGRADWRLELARLHAALGDPESAVREARAALRLRPGWSAAQRLLDEQVVLRGGL